MNLQSNLLFRNINLFHNLGNALLSGSGEFMSWQIDSTQAFITRSSQQLRTVWSDMSAAQAPAQWPEMLQNGMHKAIKLNHDYVVASTDYQMESMRLLQEQLGEVQEILVESFSEQIAAGDVAIADEKQSTKPITQPKKLAA